MILFVTSACRFVSHTKKSIRMHQSFLPTNRKQAIMTSPAVATPDALCRAVKAGDIQQVHRLLETVNPSMPNELDGRTALHIAASDGDEQLARILLARGANPNAHDRYARMPIGRFAMYWSRYAKFCLAQVLMLLVVCISIISCLFLLPESLVCIHFSNTFAHTLSSLFTGGAPRRFWTRSVRTTLQWRAS